jgi:hypothetical protein
MNYVPVVNFGKGIPKGIKKLIRKQMYMEIDYFFGNPYHKQRRLVHLLGYDSVYYINFLVLSNNWSCGLVEQPPNIGFFNHPTVASFSAAARCVSINR